ncbi:hypothetical protein [Mesobacillus selenatarsenatis]|uniref:Uncharacterized protein n=1 Tax=Mesobacillus selenatarsenatis (strain DSM 18680 / JCM 14380 / FERM P-15431 / SF-1) TaxID=1321606 RepID=A0A0A8XAA3_MESS1|nr:hypothetical protein [Mesobacillus selenatarsenatis]GAM15927.1 hypothetical protein SAMD00020551_4098 [Mesobacillus selenatarsenatis SF-1]
MDREKFVKNVFSQMISMLLASFIFMVVTQFIQWFAGDEGGEAVTWLTR